MVGIAGFRLRKPTDLNTLVILAAIALDLVVLAFFLVDTARNKPSVFVSMIVVFALNVVFRPVVEGSARQAGRARPNRFTYTVTLNARRLRLITTAVGAARR